MLNILFILFFATTTFSVKSMEISSDKKEKKNKKSSNNFSITITPQPEHPFVTAAASNNEALVKNYLNNPYFNPNICSDQTALHACIENKHYHLLPRFFTDPRIDPSIKNKASQTGHDILKQHRLKESNSTLKKQIYEWQIKYFSNLTLHTTTKQICLGLKTSYLQGKITNTVIINAIEMIKQKIEKVVQNQIVSKTEYEYVEDRKLPEAVCFPDYATDELMTKKIWWILKFMCDTVF